MNAKKFNGEEGRRDIATGTDTVVSRTFRSSWNLSRYLCLAVETSKRYDTWIKFKLFIRRYNFARVVSIDRLNFSDENETKHDVVPTILYE